MELLLLLGLGLAALLDAHSWGGSEPEEGRPTDPDDAENPEDEEMPPATIGNLFTLLPSGQSSDPQQIIGTDGDDTLLHSDVVGVGSVFDRYDISAGAGNDVIDLLEEDTSVLNLGYGTIDGGEGNDVIHLPEIAGGLFYGGDGDDDLRFVPQAGDAVRVYGGDGNDTIVAVGDAYNTNLYGGAGNDDITLFGQVDSGAGYSIGADGGAGDDTLRADTTDLLDNPLLESRSGTRLPVFTGGEGRDVLELSVAEGRYGDQELLPPDHAGAVGGEITTYAERYISGVGQTGETFSVETLVFDDFAVGEDRLELSVDSINDAFDLASIRMEVNPDAGRTAVIIRYESDTSLDREVTVWLGSVAVTWDDVDLIGADRSILVPLAPAA